ncbi:gamma-glutamyltranspeptidase [Sphingomonas sp. BE138]|uniref:hypothetical protein n=1 Tax=Sphingomonas sp. BE138 TaxID=2817845 RepID=UPI00286196BC|nr:hypothetical protein [Sphingomonas sp. BE138]MDR6787103.1 gamma-glutamyltranspeptidase [Sphingomonas sp. BE138]
MTGAAVGGVAAVAPALAMLAAFACAIGGGYLLVKRRERLKGVLMLVMAAVLVGNVLIWTV